MKSAKESDKQFFIKKIRDIMNENAEIAAKNETDREKLLAKQAEFEKKFVEAQTDVQTFIRTIKNEKQKRR